MAYEPRNEEQTPDALPTAAIGRVSCGRLSGRDYILDRAERLERKARLLRALAPSIPDNFPDEADEALRWCLVDEALSGRDYILDRAERLECKARLLRALAGSIPDNFPDEADEALWCLVDEARSLR